MCAFQIKFLGVRGSVPCSSSNYVKYGGHTSCVMVHIDDRLILFDAGTGIKDASAYVYAHDIQHIDILLTHVHLDHIFGLPFFKPIWDKTKNINIYCGTLKEFGGLQKVLGEFFNPPYFPIPFGVWNECVKCHDFTAGSDFYNHDNIKLDTCSLNHPNGSIGYKLTYEGKSVCYITDHEHGDQSADERLNKFVTNADMMIYDASYDDHKYEEKHKGWGHSTWQKACEIGEKNNVKHIALFHHDPDLNDVQLSELELKIQREHGKHIFIAKQGSAIDL